MVEVSDGRFFRVYAVYIVMQLILIFLGGVQILHISDAEVKETKMMGDSPIIIVMVGIFFSFFVLSFI